MKVLVSTTETQGQRESDFCFVPDGELVRFAMECDGEKIDGGCGCRRSMAGVVSHKATTTFKVVDAEIDLSGLTAVVRASLVVGGWLKKGMPEYDTRPQGEAKDLARIAAAFPVGKIVEKRGTRFVERRGV